MSARLRILFIASAYAGENGVNTCTYNAASGLAALGHEVHVLSCVDHQKSTDTTRDGVQVHSRGFAPVRGLRRLDRWLHTPATARRVRVAVSTFVACRRLGVRFDAVHYPDWDAGGLFFALLKSQPTVATLYLPLALFSRYSDDLELNRDTAWASFLERVTVTRADVIIALSTPEVDALREVGWLRDRQVEVIPNSIDWSRWQDVGPVADAPPTVVFIGALRRIKAPEVLAQAMAMIRETLPHAEAIFAGKEYLGPDGLPYVEWMRRSLGDLRGCHFLGRVPRQELRAVLSRSRALAVPSVFESYSNAALEGMAAGRPVVVTATTGVADLISRAGGGRVVPPNDPRALANALLPFLVDAQHAAQVGETGKRIVREWADPIRVAKLQEAAFRLAIHRNRGGRKARKV